MNKNKIKKKRVKRTPEEIAAKKDADFRKFYSRSRFSHWAEHGDLEDGPRGYENIPAALDELLNEYYKNLTFEQIAMFMLSVDLGSKNFRNKYDFNVTDEVIIESFEYVLERKPELSEENLCKYVYRVIEKTAQANIIPEPGYIDVDPSRIVGAK